MSSFLGIDASTQSISGLVVDTDTKEVTEEVSVSFDEFPEYNCPKGFLPYENARIKHADPLVWAEGLDKLFQRLLEKGVDLKRIQGISGSGQQHGTVYLHEHALTPENWSPAENNNLAGIVEPLLSRRTAPIWMDTSTTPECREIAQEAGGARFVQETTGSPPIERFSGPQIRRFYKNAPDAYENTAVIHLVSSFMASLLAGKNMPIDYGDGAGMNLMNLASGEWHQTMLEATAPELEKRLPQTSPSSVAAGTISPYFVRKYGMKEDTSIVVWSGDNPNSLIGVGAHTPGSAVVSLGTSHTYFQAMEEPKVDPEGYGHVFGNPAGGYMCLICFANGAFAQEQIANQYQLDWTEFEKLLQSAPPGNNGNMMLPYFTEEITPFVPDAKPVYVGSEDFQKGKDAAAVVRAVVEAQAFRLRLHSAWIGTPDFLRVTGGASVNDAVCQTLADVFNARVERLETGNSAALGAALRAAQAVSDCDWNKLSGDFSKPVEGLDVEPIPENVQTYEKMLPKYRDLAERYKHA